MPTAIDILAAVNPSDRTTEGAWRREGRILISPTGRGASRNAWAMLARPPGNAYRLDLTVERVEPGQGLNVGIRMGGARCAVVVDGFASNGGLAALELVDGQSGKANETTRPGKRLPVGARKELAIEVRTNRVVLLCESQEVFTWTGPVSRLSLHPTWPVPDDGRLFLGTQAMFRFYRVAWTPLG